ncbi:hypothetical protein CAPTEDRAFT_199401 [Capitella teleta]|uniref:Reverse transcriptase domain-containing protein n=1 Tax=Capitella teleta TaxID=283909 RepID=R7UX81_CAPTE|nr:hypothetical protein CAPTEDRAFT_199401 [Capitella teleta]|eukprot:ELU10902.1 hypothetical protein CAPTEDRAFT_199401 [Capitella teleta]
MKSSTTSCQLQKSHHMKEYSALLESCRNTDTVLIAESEHDLQRMLSLLYDTCQEFGMQLNAKKTKTMCVSRMEPETIQLRAEGKALEQVHQYIYLGVTITQDMRQEIKRRIAIAKSKFLENKEFPRRNLCLNLKKN